MSFIKLMLPLGFVIVWAVALVLFSWVGYIASDDTFYAMGAKGWLNSIPYLGTMHWELRLPFVIPMAVSFYYFGSGEYQMVLVTTVYYIALIVLVYLMLAKVFSIKAGLVSGLVIGVTPLMMVYASIANEDIPEAFFVLLSFCLFYMAKLTDRTALVLFLAGMAAGLAWLCKETAAGLLLFYGICFLFGYRYKREYYWWILGGFSLFWLSEWAFYWFQAGDPFYRLLVDMDQGASKHAVPIKIPGTGNLELHPLLNPFLSLFVNDEFGLLFFLALPAMAWAWRGSGRTAEQIVFLRLVTGLALTWFFTIGFIIPLRDLPRYYTVSAVLAAILVGLWLFYGNSRKRAIIIASTYIVVSLALVYVSNREPIWGSRQLVDIVKNSPELIYTDPISRNDALFLLSPYGLQNNLSEEPPTPGSLYVYNPNRVTQSTRPTGYLEAFAPQPDWVEIQIILPPKKYSPAVMELIGMRGILPDNIENKLFNQNQAVVLYRTQAK